MWKLQSEGLEDLIRAKNLELLQGEHEIRKLKQYINGMTKEDEDKNKENAADADKYKKMAAAAEEQVGLLLAQKNIMHTIMYRRVNELGTSAHSVSSRLRFCTFALVCRYSCVRPWTVFSWTNTQSGRDQQA